MRVAGGVVAASVMLAGAAAAQPASETPRDFETYTPRVDAVRIAEEDAPVIDGDLSDPAWSRADVIDEFYQVEPVEGATPSQPTRAYIMYDRKHLYVGVYCYDSEPDQIRHAQMRRDPQLRDEDGIRILIDSFGTFRDTYYFAMNPNGARSDGLGENGTTFRGEWNTIWRGKARIVDDGWIAEFAIPFQSISFDASLADWNLQIFRTIRRHNEEIRWSNIDQSRGRIDMTNPGRLGGISDIQSGLGLEVQAFVTGSASYDHITDDADFEFDPSGNIFYKITPALTGSLTFNTDFSDAPLDSRQVNTGRFSLFFPETRDFFLQDAAVFEFGGRVFNDTKNGLPFFSRNIGIVDNQPVDIIAGAKLSGKVGPASVGAISARTGAADAIGVDGQFLSAARVSVPVLAESKLGAVFTNGDPAGVVDNSVAGVDFQYKRSNMFGEGTLFADIAYMRSFGDGPDDDMTGLEVAYRSQRWNGTLRVRDIGEDYAPRLGFANRTGIRRYNANFWRTYRPQNSFIRAAETGAWTNLITDLNDTRIDHFYGAWVEVENHDGDEFEFNYQHGYVDVREPFSIAGELPVPVGEYRWNQYELSLELTRARPVGASIEVEWGGVFGGDVLEIESSLSLRPIKYFELIAEHEYSRFDLPAGKIGIHIASIDTIIAFTPDMTLSTEIQYDNISEAFAVFSRLSWEPVPEREIFLSFGHSAVIERENFPRDYRALSSGLSLRLGHTFRL